MKFLRCFFFGHREMYRYSFSGAQYAHCFDCGHVYHHPSGKVVWRPGYLHLCADALAGDTARVSIYRVLCSTGVELSTRKAGDESSLGSRSEASGPSKLPANVLPFNRGGK